MNYENFVFYGSFLKTIESIPDDYLKLQVLEAIVRYGCNWELPNAAEEPMVYAFLQMAIPTIDKQKDNYANGSKGGRPVTHTQEEYNELFDKGLKNKEVEELLKVSSSTVERKKKIWKEAKAKDKDIEREKEMEKEKEKESEDMRVLMAEKNNREPLNLENKKTISSNELIAMGRDAYDFYGTDSVKILATGAVLKVVG